MVTRYSSWWGTPPQSYGSHLPHAITQCYLMPPNTGERTHWWNHGVVWGYVPPLFENMGLIICPNLHRNSEGRGGIENVIVIHSIQHIDQD